jgi:hypothetical protein
VNFVLEKITDSILPWNSGYDQHLDEKEKKKLQDCVLAPACMQLDNLLRDTSTAATMLEFPGRMWLRWEMRGGHCS